MPQPRKRPSSRSSSTSSRSRSASRSSPSARRASGAAASQSKAKAKAKAAAGPAEPAKADANAVEQVLAALRTALTAHATESLNLVVLSRERMQQAFDDAVRRGHMTQQTANTLVADLVKRTQQEATNVVGDVEQLLGRGRTGLESAAKIVKSAPATDRALREADRARRVVGVGPAFPILGYDDLTAAQVTGRLDDLSPAELRKIRDYERRHGNRKSVLAAVERKLA